MLRLSECRGLERAGLQRGEVELMGDNMDRGPHRRPAQRPSRRGRGGRPRHHQGSRRVAPRSCSIPGGRTPQGRPREWSCSPRRSGRSSQALADVGVEASRSLACLAFLLPRTECQRASRQGPPPVFLVNFFLCILQGGVGAKASVVGLLSRLSRAAVVRTLSEAGAQSRAPPVPTAPCRAVTRSGPSSARFGSQ